jgi:hypothetical protein
MTKERSPRATRMRAKGRRRHSLERDLRAVTEQAEAADVPVRAALDSGVGDSHPPARQGAQTRAPAREGRPRRRNLNSHTPLEHPRRRVLVGEPEHLHRRRHLDPPPSWSRVPTARGSSRFPILVGTWTHSARRRQSSGPFPLPLSGGNALGREPGIFTGALVLSAVRDPACRRLHTGRRKCDCAGMGRSSAILIDPLILARRRDDPPRQGSPGLARLAGPPT